MAGKRRVLCREAEDVDDVAGEREEVGRECGLWHGEVKEAQPWCSNAESGRKIWYIVPIQGRSGMAMSGEER